MLNRINDVDAWRPVDSKDIIDLDNALSRRVRFEANSTDYVNVWFVPESTDGLPATKTLLASQRGRFGVEFVANRPGVVSFELSKSTKLFVRLHEGSHTISKTDEPAFTNVEPPQDGSDIFRELRRLGRQNERLRKRQLETERALLAEREQRARSAQQTPVIEEEDDNDDSANDPTPSEA